MSGDVLTPAEVFPPGEYLRDELDERGWTATEFAEILGRPAQAVSEILNGKKEITVETAAELGDALGTSAELWLSLQANYRLHLLRSDQPALTPVARRARLRALVPVRELQRRTWLPETDDLDVLEAAVCDLLEISSPHAEPAFAVAARRANSASAFTPEQMAWIARVRQLASDRVQTAFDREGLEALGVDLPRRVTDPYHLTDLHEWLAECGVALVIELPLKSSKLDGIAMCCGGDRPVIGLSTRGDRFDGFIFTLLHEIAHLTLKHVGPDQMCIDEDLLNAAESDIERDANNLAGSWIFKGGFALPTHRPRLPEILAMARQYGVHSSLVIGRLQREGVLDWSDFRRNIPKIRPFVNYG